MNLLNLKPFEPFITFRFLWGFLLAYSTLRFMLLGWVEDHYLRPVFHFKYWGFEWVSTFSLPIFLYTLHILLFLGAICMMFGVWYRVATIVVFITFTYTELIDLTYYLNHYYFVSVVCFLMIFFPKPIYTTIENGEGNTEKQTENQLYIPQWVIVSLKLQIAIVYVYAGLAKINYDWLVLALPLKIWLPAHDKLFLIGEIFTWKITPYIFSWFGMLYDCFIIFFLLWKKTRNFAYFTVIVFHILTGLLFQIGIFPLVMICVTLIFFDANFHKKIHKKIQEFSSFFRLGLYPKKQFIEPPLKIKKRLNLLALWGLGGFFLFQLLFPLRYLLYEGNLFWTEEGYRFSWRVMLMEKAGTATFYVKNSDTNHEIVVENREFLNAHQEKQMAMQPDMILQFAHFLGDYYEKKGVKNPQVRAEVYVTLNARPSKLLIDPKVDLMKEKDGFAPKKWILPND